jgi:hypothetical protein
VAEAEKSQVARSAGDNEQSQRGSTGRSAAACRGAEQCWRRGLPGRWYPVLRYPVLRYPVLRYPVLRYPVLRYPVLRYPVLRCPGGMAG